MVSRERIYQSVLKDSTFGCRMYNWRHLILTNRNKSIASIFVTDGFITLSRLSNATNAQGKWRSLQVFWNSPMFSLPQFICEFQLGKIAVLMKFLEAILVVFRVRVILKRMWMGVSTGWVWTNVVALLLYRISPNSLEMLYAL